MQKQVRIAVDAMGGDNAPAEIVKGALQAGKELGIELVLVGNKTAIENELKQNDTGSVKYRILEATDIIADNEQPAIALRKKPNSSLGLTVGLVRCGDVDGAVSAGPTGALMTAALMMLGPLPGVERPVIGGPFIGFAPQTTVIDLGANVGCQPYHLVNFAVMGTVYARTFQGIANPTVGLLNVGSEEGKGNDQAKEAYGLLKKSGLNFIGNVEGYDIVRGKANVIVCDGFVGNIMLKLSEALGRAVSRWLMGELQNKLAADELGKLSKKMEMLLSAATVMGGGPLWGVNGVVAKAHGASHAAQIAGAISVTKQAIDSDFVTKLRTELEKAQLSIKA